MIVSRREEALAEELYVHDMGICQGPFEPWDTQIDRVKDSYRRQASRIVGTAWFRHEIDKARSQGVECSHGDPAPTPAVDPSKERA